MSESPGIQEQPSSCWLDDCLNLKAGPEVQLKDFFSSRGGAGKSGKELKLLIFLCKNW